MKEIDYKTFSFPKVDHNKITILIESGGSDGWPSK